MEGFCGVSVGTEHETRKCNVRWHLEDHLDHSTP